VDERIANNCHEAVTITKGMRMETKEGMKEEFSTLQEGRIFETSKYVIFEQFSWSN
jgi:hypothetical protein